MGELHAAVEMARAEPDKGHPVAVLGVHVGLHLEDEARDLLLLRRNLARLGAGGLRLGREVADAVHQLLHAEGIDRRAKPDRRHVALEHRLRVELGQQLARHLDLFLELLEQFARHVLGELGVVEPVDLDRFRHLVAVGPVHQLEPVAQHVVAAHELAPHADRPRGRRHVDGEVLLDLVDDLEDVARLAVHLVAEGQDRQIAQPADLEELLRLAFHALGAVDHHDRRVDRGQRAVGVFREVRVAGRVDEVVAEVAVIEGHGRGRDRDPALLLHLHEVRARAPRLALGAHLSRHLDGAAIEQEFLRQRGLAGIRVRDDRKGAAAGDFRGKVGAVGGRVQHERAYNAAHAPREERAARNRGLASRVLIATQEDR